MLLLGASRGSVDDLARAIALERGATFGLHRLSFTQLAARLAVLESAARERAPTTALGHEAVAMRAAFEARSNESLDLLACLPDTRVSESVGAYPAGLRLAALASGDLARLPRSGSDLAALLARVDILLEEAGASDRASLFETATRALGSPVTGWPLMPLLLLDVLFESEIEAQFLWALIQQSPQVMITVPAGDTSAMSQLEKRGVGLQIVEEAKQNDLTHLTRYLFSKEPPPERTRTGELVWFSAPGEGRECVEIARRILKEAERGVRFDEMAIVIRSTQQYVGLLEHALSRAGIPAYFDRGTRRPDPTGRAFLAILSCATENFSAKRFAEYLSLAQVPSLDDSGKAPAGSGDSMWGGLMRRRFSAFFRSARPENRTELMTTTRGAPTTNINGDQAVVAGGSLRAPWKWEESAG